MSEPEAPTPPPEPPPVRETLPLPAAATAPLGSDLPPARGRRRLLLLVAAALSGFVVLACLALTLFALFTPAIRARLSVLGPLVAGNPPPEGPDKFAEPSTGPVAIDDNFSLPSKRWDRSQTRVVDGTYELTLELDNFDSYGLYLGPADTNVGPISDFDLAVDATQAGGDPVSEFGIRFRQSAPDEHLLFSISGNGYYRLARVSEQRYTSLVPWTHSTLINTELGATNRLRVVAEGPTITGFINGEQVLAYSDEQQEAGQLTLGLVTFGSGGLRVRFDNVEGYALQAGSEGAEPTRLELGEDFSDPTSAPWSVGGATVNAGSYEVFVGGSVMSWQQPLPIGSSKISGDFALEVEATLLSGNEGGTAYGLMFGDGGAFDFFALMLMPEGGIMMLQSGAEGGLLIPPTPPVVQPGLNTTTLLRVEVRGNQFIISINGQASDPLELPADVSFDGMAGLVVQGVDAEGARARFDNFKLEELE